MADRSRADRAKLFAPFASLKGYYDMILETEDRREGRRELSEDDAAALSDKLMRTEKGKHIRICCYNGMHYITLEGTVVRFEPELRMLTLGEKRIRFDDIVSLEEYEPKENYNAFLNR